jgi:selenocysteine-specific elongation factor
VTIFGLSGHVDHGKTALVKALTGIDPDRLPEEKARGMTTDLGFAALRLSAPLSGKILDIGVIDVPGHERYIRNMVSGAWSLDMALLVIAADDGWMKQTENHARVLKATGITRVVLVITKIDKVAPECLEAVCADALDRAKRIFGARVVAGIAKVSVFTGQGIEHLQTLLAQLAFMIEETRTSQPRQEGEFLFVDRVFSKRGAGRIACGSLVGTRISIEDELVHSPGADCLRVKGIESLGQALPLVTGPARVALNLGKGKREIRRGDLLYTSFGSEARVFSDREFLLKVESLPYSSESGDSSSEVLKKGGEIEIAVGTAWRIGQIIPLGKGPWYRFTCTEELAFPSTSPLVLIRHGGAEILGRAWVMFQGKMDRNQRRKVIALLEGQEDSTVEHITLLLRSALSPQKFQNPDPERATISTNSGILDPALKKAEKALKDAGKNCLEYQNTGTGNFGAANAQAGKSSASSLPPRKDIDSLCTQGLAVPLDRNLFIHRDLYLDLISRTLTDKKPGERVEISDAKQKTGFSRKYVIPFLNRMERDGYVKRSGDSRMVLRLPLSSA